MVGNAIGASRNLKEVSRSERPVQQFFIEMSALFNALMQRRELRIYIESTKSMGGGLMWELRREGGGMSWWRDPKRVLGWAPFAKVYLVRIVFIAVGNETPRMQWNT